MDKNHDGVADEEEGDVSDKQHDTTNWWLFMIWMQLMFLSYLLWKLLDILKGWPR